MSENRYALICPCRDEAAFMRRTLDSIAAQTIAPALVLVIDDGSTDATPQILEEYRQRLGYMQVMQRPDRGERDVGVGCIDALNEALATIDLGDYDFVCKLDLDLELPAAYFETLIKRMQANPRLGTCSGKPYVETEDGIEAEPCGDELSVGMTKFYRVACFEAIGGFQSILNWEAIDCHEARMRGWVVRCWDDVPALRFLHLRRMGSSHVNVLHGRYRHGAGQYIMGTRLTYILASTVYRMATWPFVIGGLAIFWGYLHAWLTGESRYGSKAFRSFLQRYQILCLIRGKDRATDQIETEQADRWSSPA